MFETLESRTLLSAGSAAAPAATGELSPHRVVSGVTLARRHAASNLLQVSSNGRYLTYADGSPFFYMADTAWELFNRLRLKQADQYLSTRAAQGFTVIQAEINARFGSGANGAPFIGNDVTRPNASYFRFVDAVVAKANSLGMYLALVPLDSTWSQNGIFNKNNTYQFGRFLGARYASAKIIWVLGGDVPGNGGGGLDMWRNLAGGIARGAANRDQSKVLITYHPYYNQSSSQWFGNESWLDFNAVQSGHSLNRDNYNLIASDYGKRPTRPVIDIEGAYEDIPAGIKAGNPRLTDYDVRKAAYWSVFAGSLGVTYGNNNVWQFVTTPNSRNLATKSWQAALSSPGVTSLAGLKRLLLSRPFLNRVPDQSMIVGATLSGTDHIQATRGADGSYAFVYSAGGKAITVNLSRLSGTQIEARWYNPRRPRSSINLGVFARGGNRTFKPPTSGANNDWVLVLDDASKRYGKP
jgi:hypothetical protein